MDFAISHIQSLMFNGTDEDDAITYVANLHKLDRQALSREYFAYLRDYDNANPQWVDAY